MKNPSGEVNDNGTSFEGQILAEVDYQDLKLKKPLPITKIILTHFLDGTWLQQLNINVDMSEIGPKNLSAEGRHRTQGNETNYNFPEFPPSQSLNKLHGSRHKNQAGAKLIQQQSGIKWMKKTMKIASLKRQVETTWAASISQPLQLWRKTNH